MDRVGDRSQNIQEVIEEFFGGDAYYDTYSMADLLQL